MKVCIDDGSDLMVAIHRHKSINDLTVNDVWTDMSCVKHTLLYAIVGDILEQDRVTDRAKELFRKLLLNCNQIEKIACHTILEEALNAEHIEGRIPL